MKYLSFQELSKIINVALASASLEEVWTPFRRIRAQIHLLLDGRVGGGKSTILYDVGKAIKQVPVISLTKANVLGTVDKDTKDFIAPVIWDCRNSALLIDEFDIDAKDHSGREALRVILTLMENSEYTKRISFVPRDFKKRNKGLFCIVKGGKISVKTRFIFFGNTMMNVKISQMQEIKALCSRCITVPYYPTLDDLKRKARGEPAYVYEKIIPKKKKVVIDAETYEKILNCVEDKNIRAEKYLRLIGDLCRVYAVLGKIDKEIFDLIIGLGE